MTLLSNALVAFSLLITAYFVLWNVSQIAMSPLAIRTLWRHRLRNTRRARRLAGGVAVPRFVSIVAPAYNEELTIVESVRALLGRRLRAARDRDRQRWVHGWLAGAAAGDLSAGARTAGVRSAVALRAGSRHLSVGQRARSRRHRQAQRRKQGRRGQRRHQRRVRRPRARHRRRHRARSRRARPCGHAVPRRPGDGGGRRQCRDRERLPHRARPRHRGRPAAQLAGAVPDCRVHALVPPVPARLRVAECRHPDLGGIRSVPPRRGDRGRRLRPDRDRRGHRSHRSVCSGIFARAASRSGLDSIPTRSAGRKRQRIGHRCGHSATAGGGGCSRRSGDIAG